MSEAQRENERKISRSSTSNSSAQGRSGKHQSADRQAVDDAAAGLVRGVPTPPKSQMTPPEAGQPTATSDTETKEIEEELAKTKLLLAQLKQQQQVAISEAEDIRTEIRALKARCGGNPR